MRARRHRNWPNVVALLAFFLASEMFDDDDGDKSVATWAAAFVVLGVVLVICRWIQSNQPNQPDERTS